ncbi:sulfurtransferase complex subunit TusC [Thalassomonas sp. M1454]|uniref:sulfurtransferase complex subunit TusC n=1 Tax=Thalassomonas sp. M1454 TaxID=2594477 RepID=UPI0011808580|nr:sulfurtransferase complex subunit TusC [Thalassomonas sp. M1454]TRX56887.1 sulfurtransferase complex subunit TusC [Thalassomonas sp. M1454]
MSTHQVKHYAIVNTTASFDSLKGKESLDAALILASYEMPVSLFFIGDGVYQTLTSQNAETIKAKDYIATFKALGFYDIDDIYVCSESLQKRGIKEVNVLTEGQCCSNERLKAKLKQCDIVLTF